LLFYVILKIIFKQSKIFFWEKSSTTLFITLHGSTQPSPILIFFTRLLAIKKQKIPSQNYLLRHKLFEFPRISRVKLSITAQSMFAVEPSVWARWKGILIENITKIKKQEKQQQQLSFFYLGSL
jgi:hypothetical protein